jgi:hypothetical protein
VPIRESGLEPFVAVHEAKASENGMEPFVEGRRRCKDERSLLAGVIIRGLPAYYVGGIEECKGLRNARD